LSFNRAYKGKKKKVRLPVLVLAFYSAIIPFDNLLAIGRAGSITRYISLLLMFLILIESTYLGKFNGLPSVRKVVLFWTGFILILLLSTTWALDKLRARQGLFTIVGLYVLYIMVAVLPIEYLDYQLVKRWTYVGGIISSIMLIVAYMSGLTLFGGDRATLMLSEQRYADPNYFSASLILPAMLLLGQFLRRNTLPRLLGLFMILFAIFLSGSRGGVISLLAAILFLVYKRMTNGKKKSILIIVFLFLLSISIINYTNPATLARMNPKNIIASGGSGRYFIWEVGWRAFCDRPLIGFGLTNFPLAYEMFRYDFPQSIYYFNRPYLESHNTYLEVLVEAGIVGFVLLVLSLMIHWKALKDKTYKNEDTIEIQAAFIGIAISAFFLSMLRSKAFWLLLFFILININLSLGQKQSTLHSHLPR